MIVPGIAIGEAHSALDIEMLVAAGFTHVLNTCACEEGEDESFHVCTGPDYYEGKLVYSGFHAHDRSDYDISANFEQSNKFLSRVCKPQKEDGTEAGKEVGTEGGDGGGDGGSSSPLPDPPCTQIMRRKVMVHCKAGASRSASAVLAFFVHAGMPLRDAVRLVRAKREIAPNNGFLRRLVEYAREVETKRAADGGAGSGAGSGAGAGADAGAVASSGAASIRNNALAAPPAPAQAASSTPRRIAAVARARVVCFGASLTEGLSLDNDAGAMCEVLAPYSDNLSFPKEWTVEVENHGISGERAVDMAERLNEALFWPRSPSPLSPPRILQPPQPPQQQLAASSCSPRVQVVAIMGGTNDLASGDLSADEIAAAIVALHTQARTYQHANADAVTTLTVQCTIPTAIYSRLVDNEAFEAKRLVVNEQLRAWVAQQPSDEVQLVELEEAFDRTKYPERYCADGIHFSPAGYAVLGSMVSAAIVGAVA